MKKDIKDIRDAMIKLLDHGREWEAVDFLLVHMHNPDVLGDNKIRDTLMAGMEYYYSDISEWCQNEFPGWPQPEEEDDEE